MKVEPIINEKQFVGHEEKRNGIEKLFPENTVMVDFWTDLTVWHLNILYTAIFNSEKKEMALFVKSYRWNIYGLKGWILVGNYPLMDTEDNPVKEITTTDGRTWSRS